MMRATDLVFSFNGKGGETTFASLAAFLKELIVGVGVSIFEKQAAPRFSGFSEVCLL